MSCLKKTMDIIIIIKNIFQGTYWQDKFYLMVYEKEPDKLLVNIRLGFTITPDRFDKIVKEIKSELMYNTVDSRKLIELGVDLIHQFDYSEERHVLGFMFSL